ncbi:MAG: serine/threonine-protein kinase [Kofleriaceae bacterium]
MEPVTPSKRRAGEPVDHDQTEVAVAAPWELDQDPDGTQNSIAPAPAPTPTRKNPAKGYALGPGTTLGEYRIEKRIGQGGMGEVFSAVHPMIGKRAAIKILKQELCADPFNVERFVDEARIVNQIGHPNIVDVFAFGEMPDGRSYFVMEWLKGESLRSRMARAPITLDELCVIVRQLARALEAAHAQGVIHRDLKPDNIYLVESEDHPTVKLLDFGIAKLARNDHRIERTATGAMVGTPQYIAPEQAKGYAIDHRADIYALGGILFEILAGEPPFVADNAMEIVAKHLMEPPRRASSVKPDIPEELDDVVLAMLAKDPPARPPLAELVRVIERVKAQREPDPDAPTGQVLITPQPIAAVTAEPTAPIAISTAIEDAETLSVPSKLRPGTQLVREPLPPKRLLAFAVAGAVLAGIVAFVIVTALGSSHEGVAPVQPEPAPPPTPVAVPVREPEPPAIVATPPSVPTPRATTTPRPPPPVRVRIPPARVKPLPVPHSKPLPPAPPDDKGLMEPGSVK